MAMIDRSSFMVYPFSDVTWLNHMVNSLSGGLLLSLIHTEISTPGFLRNFMRRPLLVGSGDPGVGRLVKKKVFVDHTLIVCVPYSYKAFSLSNA